MNNYRCVTSVQKIQNYIGNATVVAFDYETAPDEPYRTEEKAALDLHKSHIAGYSFSIKEHTGIYVPVAHKIGENIDNSAFLDFLKMFLASKNIIKIAHNIAFESAVSYHQDIVIQPPVYDTICAAQMTLKSNYEFRKLADSGLKRLASEICHEPLPTFNDVTNGRHFDELDAQDSETVRYGCADSDFALRLYHIFNNWFDRFLPKHRYIVEQIESPTAVYLGIMKHNGVPVDADLMKSRQQEAENQMQRIRNDITMLIGDIEIGANCGTKAFKDYLYQTLKLPVMKVTASNKEAADDASMIMLKEWCDTNRPELSSLFTLVQEYRKWGKIKSTYIDGYLKYLSSATGGIHPDFFALSTETGRMNCRNPNLQNCFDEETEILTERGFVRFCDLLDTDKVAQWDDGKIMFVKPLDYISRQYNGEMIRLKNQHIDMMMTPDHRCLVQNRKTKKYSVYSAEDYPEDFWQIHAGNYTFGNRHISLEMVTLLAATQADGYFHDGGIDFWFTKARKYRRLKNTLDAINAVYTEGVKPSTGQVRIRIVKGALASEIMHILTEEKKWGAWILECDRDTVLRILEELPHWDGCFTIQNMYSSSVKENADWMQILYTLTDTRAHLREYRNGNPNANVNYQIDITHRNYSSTTNIEKDMVSYHGMVYCVSVPSGFIVVRRNGNTAVTGNCPRKSNDPIGVRNFIKAPKNHLILSLDFSQIELRVGAFYCRDRTMMETYKNDGDIHAATTAVIFGCTYEEAQNKHRKEYKEQRTIAKNVNFGTFYGLFPKGLQSTLKFKAGVEKSVDECTAIIANLKAGYPALTTWQEETKQDAARKMYIETWLGRRRYLPNIRSDNWGLKSFAERCALNTPIQGTAADILKLAIVRILEGLPSRPWLKPILQIHDELTFIIPEEKLNEAVGFIRECMEKKPFPEFDLPLVAEASAGENFGNLEELEE